MVFSWQFSSVSGKGFSFHHCCEQHGKVFLSWRNNCSSGQADFKTCLSVQGHRRQDHQGERKTWGTKMKPFSWVSSLFPSSVEWWVSISTLYINLGLPQNPEQLFMSAWPGCSKLLFLLYPGADEIFSFLLFMKQRQTAAVIAETGTPNLLAEYSQALSTHIPTFSDTDGSWSQLSMFSDKEFAFPEAFPKFTTLHQANLCNKQHLKILFPIWAPGCVSQQPGWVFRKTEKKSTNSLGYCT